MHHNWRVTPALHNERKPECRNKDRAQPQNNQITFLRNRILKYLKVDKKKNVILYWNDGEPNNYFTREFTYENVAAMNSGWNDVHEKNTADIYGFICEWDKVTVDLKQLKKEY